MREVASKPVYLADVYSDPVIVRIDGRACFQNCSHLRDFMTQMARAGKSRFVFDFTGCTSMDSTFLGVLAGVALELRKRDPKGGLILAHVGARNLELIRNLGLHRLMTVDISDSAPNSDRCDVPLTCPESSELEKARLVLDAHENLVDADGANLSKFQDVLAFMRNRIDQG